MKKIFISILSAAMFAACAKTETEDVIPVNPKPEDEAQTVYVEIGATTGSDTKATYDENLAAYWEAGDQILVVQGLAVGNSYTITTKESTVQANSLNLTSGENSNSAIFAGNISTQTSDAKYFHFAYPASGTSLSTYGKKQGSSFSNVVNTTTCTYTVPSEQDGKWTPFLCTSTTDKTKAENITNINFGTARNACFAVRVFETDGKTPKKIKSITITADNNIVGTISATTENDGSFNDDKVVFGISGGGNTITADNLQNIEPLNELYEYRFEVLPSDAGFITLRITDENGSVVERKTSTEKTFTANKRSGVNVKWDSEGITIEPTTWFEDSCAKNELSTLSSTTTIYCDVTLFGIGADDIKEKGVLVNGTEDYKNNDSSHKFSSEIAATNGNGAYTVQAYAILNDGREFKSDEKTVYIVDKKVLPAITSHTIRSSYNNNGAVEKTNDINGNIINAIAQLNNCWASNNLVKSVTLVYGESPETDPKTEIKINEITTIATNTLNFDLTKSQLTSQTYKNACLKVTFKNDYTIYTPKYEINVTGIPYWWYNDSNGVKVQRNTVSSTHSLYIPTSTINVTLTYNIELIGKSIANNGILTIDGNQIFSEKPGYNKTISKKDTQQLSLSTKSIDFKYEDSSSRLSTSYSMIYEVSIKY